MSNKINNKTCYGHTTTLQDITANSGYMVVFESAIRQEIEAKNNDNIKLSFSNFVTLELPAKSNLRANCLFPTNIYNGYFANNSNVNSIYPKILQNYMLNQEEALLAYCGGKLGSNIYQTYSEDIFWKFLFKTSRSYTQFNFLLSRGPLTNDLPGVIDAMEAGPYDIIPSNSSTSLRPNNNSTLPIKYIGDIKAGSLFTSEIGSSSYSTLNLIVNSESVGSLVTPFYINEDILKLNSTELALALDSDYIIGHSATHKALYDEVDRRYHIHDTIKDITPIPGTFDFCGISSGEPYVLSNSSAENIVPFMKLRLKMSEHSGNSSIIAALNRESINSWSDCGNYNKLVNFPHIDKFRGWDANYDFNAILLYYDVYAKDANGDYVYKATNAYGLYILDGYSSGTDAFGSLTKEVTSINNNLSGTGFNFKIGINLSTPNTIVDKASIMSVPDEDLRLLYANLLSDVDTLNSNLIESIRLNTILYDKLNTTLDKKFTSMYRELNGKVSTLKNEIADLKSNNNLT